MLRQAGDSLLVKNRKNSAASTALLKPSTEYCDLLPETTGGSRANILVVERGDNSERRFMSDMEFP
jgi:hypothetical protein